jgi:hypothetical protein
MDSIVRWVFEALVVASTLIGAFWCVAYHVVSRGDWRRTEVGRHLMTFMITLSAVTATTSVRIVVVDWLGYAEPVWFHLVRLLVFAGVPVIYLWRWRLLFRPERADAEG